MSFLSLPSQDGLFTAIKAGKSAAGAEARSRTDAGDDNEEEVEDDDTEDVRLIPRCSPVPRKRGASIYEETAEYMRIHFALAAGKRVSFADTTGGDLVDVREFVAFDSDEESDSEKWEQEQAKYRKPDREPTYSLHLEFQTPPPEALLHAVRNNKVEVEQIAPAEDDPLAFRGVIRVLNVSFHKAVYIRSTMDNWANYFDHPAEYVQGSHHGDTDQFSFKLCFAPPFTSHGSRLEFVVRYETAEGDFWANNSSLNYGVTLLLSYEDEPAVAIANTDEQQIRSILKPPKVYSLNDEPESDEEQDREEEEAGISKTEVARPVPMCPVIIQPDLDLEAASCGSLTTSNHKPLSVGDHSSPIVSSAKPFPCMSSETTLQSNSTHHASKPIQPKESQPLPRIHFDLVEQMSEQSTPSGPPTLVATSSSSLQESRQISEHFQAENGGVTHLLAIERNLLSSIEEDETELPAECASTHSVTRVSEQEVTLSFSDLAKRQVEDSVKSAEHVAHGGGCLSSMADSRVSVGAEENASTLLEFTENPSVNTGLTEVSSNKAALSVSAWEEKEGGPCIYSKTTPKSEPLIQAEVSGLLSESAMNLMPCIFFLSGVVSFSVVMQTPTALFFIGLFLVLHHL